jgi:hypothetical protein
MSLYHSQHLGKTEFYFWYGQVVGGPEWECNHQHKIHDRDEPKGWGYRCKVAIFGSDPRIVTDGVAKNSELVMAEVMLPTTGGGGIGGPISTPAIGNNSFVVGFYKDGVGAREPIIMGVLPNISQSKPAAYESTEEVRYNAASGYDTTKDIITTSSLYTNDPVFPFDENWNIHTFNVSEFDQWLDPRLETFRFPVSYRCEEEGGELKGIQAILQDAMKYVAFVSKQSSLFAASVSDLRNGIDNIINKATLLISALIKIIVTRIRELTINLFEKVVQFFINLTPANIRSQVVDGIKAETDILSCIFAQIIRGIVALVRKIVSDILNNAVSSLMCTAENLVGRFLSEVLGPITEGINNAISGISSIVGGVVEFANNIFNALGFIFGILNILTCQEEYACPNVEEWNFWYGQRDTTDNISKEIDKVLETLAKNGGNSNVACNGIPFLSGPPKIKVKGGKRDKSKDSDGNEGSSGTGGGSSGTGGNEFLGNAIISPSGQIIAVDIINPGSGYTKPPILIVEDSGGNGSGAVLRPILNENGGVEEVVILDSGTGYLDAPNGSTGIGGIEYSSSEDTIIFRSGEGYNSFPPNTNVEVQLGDLIYLPPGTTGEIYNSQGELVQSFTGFGLDDPTLVIESGTLGTPAISFEGTLSSYPTSSDSKYPIVLELKDTFIKNPGINYQNGDEITIEPSNGAELVPKFNSLGALQSIEIVNTGIGFTEIPRIFIESNSGFNVIIIPIFGVNRIGDLSEEGQNDIIKSIPQSSILEVVDCVGFIPPKKKFELVPE